MASKRTPEEQDLIDRVATAVAKHIVAEHPAGNDVFALSFLEEVIRSTEGALLQLKLAHEKLQRRLNGKRPA
jgi:hypothetical protein